MTTWLILKINNNQNDCLTCIIAVVILAEDNLIQDKLDAYGLKVQTVEEAYPIRVLPARALSQIYSQLGKYKLGNSTFKTWSQSTNC